MPDMLHDRLVNLIESQKELEKYRKETSFRTVMQPICDELITRLREEIANREAAAR